MRKFLACLTAVLTLIAPALAWANDTPGQAQSLTLSSTGAASARGHISPQYDIDWWRFTTTSRGDITIELDVPSSLDYDILVYGPNSSSSQVGGGARSSGYDENVSLEDAAAGTYYVKIYGYGGDYSSSAYYYLDVDFDAYPEADLQSASVSATEVTVGQPVTLTLRARNVGGEAAEGGISVSFPDLDSANDADGTVSSSGAGLTVQNYARNSSIYNASGSSISADYLLAEATREDWAEDDSRTLTVTFTPKRAKTYSILVRTWMASEDYGHVSYDPTSGYLDQQGLRNQRIQVRAVYPVADLVSSSVSQTQVLAGDAVTVTASARNTGGRAHEGGISMSFPGVTTAGGTGATVSGSSSALTVATFDRGATLSGRTGSITADHVLVEGTAQNWAKNASESMSARVTYYTPGTYEIRIRCWMATRDYGYVSDDPTSGDLQDQQGYYVERHFVHVLPKPIPGAITSRVSASVVELGDSFSITATVPNDGDDAAVGGIAISLPAVAQTHGSDAVVVGSSSTLSVAEYEEGDRINGASGEMYADYVLVEGTTTSWLQDASHSLALTVTPQRAGEFVVYVRVWMASDDDYTFVAYAPNAAPYIARDQQQFLVKVHTVSVVAPPIEIESLEVTDGNGDTRVNPVELVGIVPLVRNNGTRAMTDVAVSVVGTPEHVTVHRRSVGLANIPAGESATPTLPLEISVARERSLDEPLVLTLELSRSGFLVEQRELELELAPFPTSDLEVAVVGLGGSSLSVSELCAGHLHLVARYEDVPLADAVVRATTPVGDVAQARTNADGEAELVVPAALLGDPGSRGEIVVTSVGGFTADNAYAGAVDVPFEVLPFRYERFWAVGAAGGVGGGVLEGADALGEFGLVVHETIEPFGAHPRVGVRLLSRKLSGAGPSVGASVGAAVTINGEHSGAYASGDAGVIVLAEHADRYDFDDLDSRAQRLRFGALAISSTVPRFEHQVIRGPVDWLAQRLLGFDELRGMERSAFQLEFFGTAEARAGWEAERGGVRVGDPSGLFDGLQLSSSVNGRSRAGTAFEYHDRGVPSLGRPWQTRYPSHARSTEVGYSASLEASASLRTSLADVLGQDLFVGTSGDSALRVYRDEEEGILSADLVVTDDVSKSSSRTIEFQLDEEMVLALEAAARSEFVRRLFWPIGFEPLTLDPAYLPGDVNGVLEIAADRSVPYRVFESLGTRREQTDIGLAVGVAAEFSIAFSADVTAGRRVLVEEGVVEGGRRYPHQHADRDLLDWWLPPIDLEDFSSLFRDAAELALDEVDPDVMDAAYLESPEDLTYATEVANVRLFVGGSSRDVFVLSAGSELPDMTSKTAGIFDDASYGHAGYHEVLAADWGPLPSAEIELEIPRAFAGLAPERLSLFRWENDTSSWRPLPTRIATSGDRLVATITEPGTVAMATIRVDEPVILRHTAADPRADGWTVIQFATETLFTNAEAVVVNGAYFTISAVELPPGETLAELLVEADADPNIPGIQLETRNGRLSFGLRSPVEVGLVHLRVDSVLGQGAGDVFVDVRSPDAVALDSARDRNRRHGRKVAWTMKGAPPHRQFYEFSIDPKEGTTTTFSVSGRRGYLPELELWDGSDRRVEFGSYAIKKHGRRVIAKAELTPGTYRAAVRSTGTDGRFDLRVKYRR